MEKKKRHNNTSREIRDKWDKEHLQRYNIYFRTDLDADIISAVDYLKKQGYKTTDVFRELIRNGLD